MIVVSIFLPVILARTKEGEWQGEWDYESLISMSSQLRVTTVKKVGGLAGGEVCKIRVVCHLVCLSALECVSALCLWPFKVTSWT